jgi:hypothetical protein
MQWYTSAPSSSGQMLIVLQLDLIPLNRSFRDVAETCEMALRYSHWAGNPQSTYGAAVPSWFELFLQLPCDGAPIAHRNGGSAMLHLCSPLKPQEADIQMLSYHLGYAVCYVNAVPPRFVPRRFNICTDCTRRPDIQSLSLLVAIVSCSAECLQHGCHGRGRLPLVPPKRDPFRSSRKQNVHSRLFVFNVGKAVAVVSRGSEQ